MTYEWFCALCFFFNKEGVSNDYDNKYKNVSWTGYTENYKIKMSVKIKHNYTNDHKKLKTLGINICIN